MNVLPGEIAVTETVISPRFGTLNGCTAPTPNGCTEPVNVSVLFWEGSVGPPHDTAAPTTNSHAARRPTIISRLAECGCRIPISGPAIVPTVDPLDRAAPTCRARSQCSYSPARTEAAAGSRA